MKSFLLKTVGVRDSQPGYRQMIIAANDENEARQIAKAYKFPFNVDAMDARVVVVSDCKRKVNDEVRFPRVLMRLFILRKKNVTISDCGHRQMMIAACDEVEARKLASEYIHPLEDADATNYDDVECQPLQVDTFFEEPYVIAEWRGL